MGSASPFWARVERANTILLAGCGGGFDIFQGMPVYSAIRGMPGNKQLHLASLNFSAIYDGEHGIASMGKCAARHEAQCVYASDDQPGSSEVVMTVVDSDWELSQEWEEKAGRRTFPELQLARFLKDEYSEDIPVYTFDRVGPALLLRGYRALLQRWVLV